MGACSGLLNQDLGSSRERCCTLYTVCTPLDPSQLHPDTLNPAPYTLNTLHPQVGDGGEPRGADGNYDLASGVGFPGRDSVLSRNGYPARVFEGVDWIKRASECACWLLKTTVLN